MAELTPLSAVKEATSRWRVLTAYLRPETTTDHTYTQTRDAAIHTAASAFCNAFAPWTSAAGNNGNDRLQNLLEIMRSATDAGILVFAQPSEFEYRWTLPAEARSGRRVVVTPAFVKVSDEYAKPLERSQIMVHQVVDKV